MPIGSSFLGRASVSPRLGPGRTPITDGQSSFAGGLNTIAAPDALAPNQFARGDNGRLTIYGAFTKRGGTQRTAAALVTAQAIQNGVSWNKADGTVTPAAVCNGTLFTTSYGAFPLTWTQRGSGGALSAVVNPAFANFVQGGSTETLYIADGGKLSRLQGTTLTTHLAATPTMSLLAAFNERLWGAGDTSNPQSLYYSALNDGDSCGVVASNGGTITVRTFGNQKITGLMALGSSLLVFHQTGVSRITGFGQSDTTASPAAISGDVGTIAPFSLVRVDSGVATAWGVIGSATGYFVSERGLYVVSEAQVTPVGTPETPDPLLPVLQTLTATQIANIRCVLSRSTLELWIAVPTVGVYCFHTILRAWSGPWIDGYLSPDTTALFETFDSAGVPVVWRGDASGFVSECDRANVFADNVAADGSGGTSYAMALRCRRFFGMNPATPQGGADPQLAKAFRYAYVLAQLNGSNAFAINWSTSSDAGSVQLPVDTSAAWNGAGTTWNTGTWNAVNQASQRVNVDGNGYFLDLTLTDSSMVAPVVSSVRVDGFALGRR